MKTIFIICILLCHTYLFTAQAGDLQKSAIDQVPDAGRSPIFQVPDDPRLNDPSEVASLKEIIQKQKQLIALLKKDKAQLEEENAKLKEQIGALQKGK